MSIQEEIERISNAKEDIKESIIAKGVEVSDEALISDYSAAINAIPTPSDPPTATLYITENGEYDVLDYAKADVQVPNPSTGTLSITENGSYDVTEKAGVNVNVAGGPANTKLKTVANASGSTIPAGTMLGYTNGIFSHDVVPEALFAPEGTASYNNKVAVVKFTDTIYVMFHWEKGTASPTSINAYPVEVDANGRYKKRYTYNSAIVIDASETVREFLGVIKLPSGKYILGYATGTGTGAYSSIKFAELSYSANAYGPIISVSKTYTYSGSLNFVSSLRMINAGNGDDSLVLYGYSTSHSSETICIKLSGTSATASIKYSNSVLKNNYTLDHMERVTSTKAIAVSASANTVYLFDMATGNTLSSATLPNNFGITTRNYSFTKISDQEYHICGVFSNNQNYFFKTVRATWDANGNNMTLSTLKIYNLTSLLPNASIVGSYSGVNASCVYGVSDDEVILYTLYGRNDLMKIVGFDITGLADGNTIAVDAAETISDYSIMNEPSNEAPLNYTCDSTRIAFASTLGRLIFAGTTPSVRRYTTGDVIAGYTTASGLPSAGGEIYVASV